MADCNTCSSYLSSEDIIRRSVKCSGGSVAFIGSNVNPLPPENAIRFEGTNELIHFENDETEQYIIFETS